MIKIMQAIHVSLQVIHASSCRHNLCEAGRTHVNIQVIHVLTCIHCIDHHATFVQHKHIIRTVHYPGNACVVYTDFVLFFLIIIIMQAVLKASFYLSHVAPY